VAVKNNEEKCKKERLTTSMQRTQRPAMYHPCHCVRIWFVALDEASRVDIGSVCEYCCERDGRPLIADRLRINNRFFFVPTLAFKIAILALCLPNDFDGLETREQRQYSSRILWILSNYWTASFDSDSGLWSAITTKVLSVAFSVPLATVGPGSYLPFERPRIFLHCLPPDGRVRPRLLLLLAQICKTGMLLRW
jgi:hypothetical protein